MGQGLGFGLIGGTALSIVVVGAKLPVATHASIALGGTAAGLAIDLCSDIFAREGKCVIERDVVLNATDLLRHVSSFYCYTASHPVARLIKQKHEWLVLESHGGKFYTVQKSPKTGDVMIEMRNSLRTACNCGLEVAGRPSQTGEIRQRRMDQDFDLPNDLQVAYVIAWLRKEDPRWALSTENSRHFCSRLRFALNDF